MAAVRVVPGRSSLPAWPLAVVLLALAALLCVAPRAAAQASADDVALARTYAPVVRLPGAPAGCHNGEPYQPIDIDLIMDDDEVALRGPWDRTNLVKVGPDANDLRRGLPGYHLDFPGDTLRPGCVFEDWSRRLNAQGPPTTYARVVTERGYPGQLALQYWFFYVFNDWNNAHEGDWEMIQLIFDAHNAREALAKGPREVGYSQHSSAERAEWGDPKMTIVGGTHPVVYPAEGSNANFFSSHVYLMRSSAEGVGCDDTSDVSSEIRPAVLTIPSRRPDYLREFGWLGFDGRWGELHAGVFNGPTGPNDKRSWTEPITWSQESWRDRSFTVPSGGALGTTATDFFCGAVARGSEVLRRAKTNPGAAAAIVGGLAVLLLWGLSRTSWSPSAPLPAARRRPWGGVVKAAFRMFGAAPRTFLGIGLLFIPLGLIITGVQWLVFRASTFDPLVDEAGERNAFVAALVFGLGLMFTLLGFAVVQAATAWAVRALDEGRPAGAVAAYRAVARRPKPLLAGLAVLVIALVLLDATVVLIPVAAYVLVRWCLIGVIAGSEDDPRPGLLRRSAALTRRAWWRTASLLLVASAGLALGPVVGVLALLVSGATFDLVNMIAAVVYVVTLPIAALVTVYLYHDLRARPQEAEAAEEAVAPA
jgi:hypothetical protein